MSHLALLKDACDEIDCAVEKIGRVWAASVESRTPRMADAVSLIERGLQKLRHEAGRPFEPQRTTQEFES